MQPIESLEFDRFYHIYNRGINGEDLFKETTNFEYFLNLYGEHINSVAETFAFCLMRNHFHFLIRIKSEKSLKDYSKRHISQSFSNLFNAYTKAYNKKYHRHGSLFERPFKRKSISNMKYLRNLICYIHNNPVHHGFCEHPVEYPWSSYLSCISQKSTKICRNEVLSLFDDLENFKQVHSLKKYDYTFEF